MTIEEILGLLITYVFAVELFLAAVVYLLPLPKRKGSVVRFSAGALGYLVSIRLFDLSLIWLFSVETILESPLAYTLHFVYVFLAVVGIVLLTCDVTLIDAAHCVAFAYATQHFAYCLHRIVFRVEDATLHDGRGGTGEQAERAGAVGHDL